MKPDKMHDGVFMLLDARKRFLKKTGLFLRTCLSRIRLLPTKKICSSADSYTIVAPVSMVRVGGNNDAQQVHILVYGRVFPAHPGVTVQVAFQGHQLNFNAVDNDSVNSDQTRPLTTLTDRAGEFVLDEKFRETENNICPIVQDALRVSISKLQRHEH